MRCLAARACAMLLLATSIAAAQTTITDATGRHVTLPATIERVFAAGPPASVLVLALAPNKLIGWTRAPHGDERPFLPEDVAALPALGRLTGRGNTANVEVVLRARPDVIVGVGSTTATYVTLAERVEEQTHVPYLLFNGTLADTPRLLRDVGHALGVDARAQILANDAQNQLRDVAERIARIPERDRPRVYFARGPNGLTTAPRGSLQAEALALAGATNVIAPPDGFSGNLFNVSLEDVLAAQPDVIISSDPSFAGVIRELPGWRDLPAVRHGRVYMPPDVPFGWFDAPPSLNRLLGVQWLVRLLHPTLFPEPLGPVVKAFHTLYYHRTPTDAQIRALLKAAGLPR